MRRGITGFRTIVDPRVSYQFTLCNLSRSRARVRWYLFAQLTPPSSSCLHFPSFSVTFSLRHGITITDLLFLDLVLRRNQQLRCSCILALISDTDICTGLSDQHDRYVFTDLIRYILVITGPSDQLDWILVHQLLVYIDIVILLIRIFLSLNFVRVWSI